MKAIGFKESLPISDPNSFIEFETEKPTASGYDLLVKVAAISVNPVDFKIRQNAAKGKVLNTPKIIGCSMFTTDDMDRQHDILNILGDLLNAGTIKTTLTTTLEGFTVKNLKEAHTMQESGKSIGKTVIQF